MIDWKRFYRGELLSDDGRTRILAALARWDAGDAGVGETLRGGGVVSFPHTTLRDSAEPLARVAATIVDGGFASVVALGVLHLSTLPEPERALAEQLPRGGAGARAAFERLRGAFVEAPVPGLGARAVRVDPGLLAQEFSLDLFRGVLELAAARRGQRPPRVAAVYVGPTRDPDDGSLAAARDVAADVAGLLPGAACVATGDLVHFGGGYSRPEELALAPAGLTALEAHFRRRVGEMLAQAFVASDLDGALAAARELRSDQRHLLPVLAEIVGRPARPELLSFRLTDYAEILGEARPCVVASALVAVRRGGAEPTDSGIGS